MEIGELSSARARRIVTALSGLPGLFWIVLIAAAMVLVYGIGWVGYDTMYALIWGRDLREGQIPDFETPIAPTPHPLSNFAGIGLSLFGDAAIPITQALIMLSFGLLGWSAFCLGRILFSWPVGALFALLLLTNEFLARLGFQSTVDVPFLALIVYAGLLEAREPRRGMAVLIVLALAGLMRPEAWLLTAAYWLYLFPKATREERLRFAAAAACAPVIWALFDLIATGNLLHSIQGTQDLAAQLERAAGLDLAFEWLDDFLELIVGWQVLVIGIVGAILGCGLFWERFRLPALTGALGLAAFFVVAVIGFSVLPRYVIVPAIVLVFACSLATFGWLSLPRGSQLRLPWIAASIAALVLLVPEIGRSIDDIRGPFFSTKRESERDLRRLAEDPAVEAAYRRCKLRTYVQTFRVVPQLAYALDLSPTRFRFDPNDPELGFAVLTATPLVSNLYLGTNEPAFRSEPPEGFRLIRANDSWKFYARC